MTKAAKLTGLSSIILLLLLLSTDPQGLPSVVLVAPFILLFIAVSAAVSHALNTYGLFKQKRGYSRASIGFTVSWAANLARHTGHIRAFRRRLFLHISTWRTDRRIDDPQFTVVKRPAD